MATKKFTMGKNTDDLFQTILNLKNKKEAKAFFRDLCTIDEIKSMYERWEIVKLLDKECSYREIAKKLKVSTTTVARVALWLNNGKNGYKLMLKRKKSKI